MTLSQAIGSWLLSRGKSSSGAPAPADVQNAMTFPWVNVDGWNTVGASAGFAVNPDTAMRLATVYRCATLISGAVSTLPLPIFREREVGVREPAGKTDLWYLLNEKPCNGWNAAQAWDFVVLSMLLRGRGLYRIVPNSRNEPIELRPIHPDKALVERTRTGMRYFVDDVGERTEVDERYMLDFTMPGFDGKRSPSVIEQAALQTVGTSLRTEDHAARLFETGAANRVALTTTGPLKTDQQDALRESWANTYGNANDPRRLPLVLTNGTDVKTISLTAADAQLLETRRFHVEDICRAFGVPPWMAGAMDKTTSWGAGIEQAGIAFVTYTLGPHLHRIENELNTKLFRRAGLMVEFNVEGLLRGDSKSRADFYRQGIGGSNGPGYITPNEVRRKENLPPLPGGDVLFSPTAVGSGAANADQPSGTGP